MGAYLPLLIELRTYAGLCADAKCETFLEFLEYLGKTEGWGLTAAALHNYLKNDGRAVVIFDGLDEIFDPEQRERITHQIVGFVGDYPKARVIVTSRVIGYRRKILTDAGFTHFTLQDLEEKQVETFVSRWYDLAMSERPDEAKERRERILRSFKESASIRQLAGNPMLLTIMAIIGKQQELPRERWKLYDRAASVLIQHWDVNKHLKDERIQADFIGEDDKKELLRRLAFRMQSGEGGLAGNYIYREQLQAEFESYLRERYAQTPDRAVTIARAMIEQFRARNFILCLYGANIYGFVHRAFLEYFCASAFVYKFEKTKELTIEQLKTDVYGKHWEDQSWHEVLRLICGMIDERWAGEIVDYLANEAYIAWSDDFDKRPPWNIILAAWCLGEARNLNAVTESAGQLLKVVCSVFECAVKVQSDATYFFLRDRLLPAIGAVGSNWPSKHILVEWLRQFRSFDGVLMYDELLGSFIGSVGKGVPEIYEHVLRFAKHEDENYRVLAPVALAEGWPNETSTLPLLRDFAVNDTSEAVRADAVFSLAEHFRSDSQTLQLVLDRALSDTDEFVRRVAVWSLALFFSGEAQTLHYIHDRAVNDESPKPEDKPSEWGEYYVREVAIRVIVEYWRMHPDTLPLLHDRAENDPTPWLRERAKELIKQIAGKEE